MLTGTVDPCNQCNQWQDVIHATCVPSPDGDPRLKTWLYSAARGQELHRI